MTSFPSRSTGACLTPEPWSCDLYKGVVGHPQMVTLIKKLNRPASEDLPRRAGAFLQLALAMTAGSARRVSCFPALYLCASILISRAHAFATPSFLSRRWSKCLDVGLRCSPGRRDHFLAFAGASMCMETGPRQKRFSTSRQQAAAGLHTALELRPCPCCWPLHLAAGDADVGDGGQNEDTTIPRFDTESEVRPLSGVQRSLISVLKGYKTLISPLLPPSCRFLPTCRFGGHVPLGSDQSRKRKVEELTGWKVLTGIWLTLRACGSIYAMQAIEDFGPLKGITLTAWRLLRCNPVHWGDGGKVCA